MELVLTPETQRLIEQRLQSGEFQSLDELVRAALQALDAEIPELDEATLRDIQEAERQIERGEGRDWKDVREQVRQSFLGK